jgi:heterodisulfide reductase subunit D
MKGASKYTRRQLLEMASCTNCRICADVCPAVSASGDGGLSAVARIERLKALLKRRHPLIGRLLRRGPDLDARRKSFGESAFRCTLCGNCEEACPVGIRLKDLWLSAREDCVEGCVAPAKLAAIRKNLKGERNVFAEDPEERALWVEDLDDAPADGLIRERADTVYFAGCVSAYFPLAQKIPRAFVEILAAAGVDFTLLGPEEWCCGFPLLGAGMKADLDELVAHNLEAVRRKGAREVVFSCPSCYQMWREHYPGEVALHHASEYLGRLISERRVPLKALDLKVTYHDPCDLGRGAGVYEGPRAILRAIPGVSFVELARHRENCACCGGGGNLEMVDADLAGRIAKLKIDEVLATGAQAVVTSCQQCVRTMTSYVRRNKIPLEVMDIVQLVRRALG